MPTLYHYPLDPFSRRVRLSLGEHDIAAELAEEQPWAPGRTFLDLNPTGILPILLEDGGATVTGAEAIGEYIEETAPPGQSQGGLLGAEPLQRAEVRRLVAWFDTRFYREVSRPILTEKIQRRFAKPEEGGGAPNMVAVRAGLQNIRPHLALIGALVEKRNWLAGDELSLADLAAAAQLSCIDYLGDVPWSENTAAKDWYVRIKSRPSFRPLLADHIRGMPPPRTYADLDF
ncbi:MAG: glutathione S-transferase family protein [Pseudomonadota bacterium]